MKAPASRPRVTRAVRRGASVPARPVPARRSRPPRRRPVGPRQRADRLGQDRGRRVRRPPRPRRGRQGLLHDADQGALEPEVRRSPPHATAPTRSACSTGDNSINGQAPIVVMTTEVLRNMIHAEPGRLADLRYVVLDEVHFLQDRYRGGVWEEVILGAPPSVTLVCLSATVANADQLAAWISEVRGATGVVIETHRPVELKNLFVVGDRSAERLHLLPTFVDGRPNPEAVKLDELIARPGRPEDRRPVPAAARRQEAVLSGPSSRSGRPQLYRPRRVEVVERLGRRAPPAGDLLRVLAGGLRRVGAPLPRRRAAADDARGAPPDPRHRRVLRRPADRRGPGRARLPRATWRASRRAWLRTTPGWCRRFGRRSRRASPRRSSRSSSPPRRSRSGSTCRHGRSSSRR